MNLGNIFELAIVLRAIDRATAPVRGVIGEINQAGEAAQEASKNFEGFFVAGEALKSFGESGLEGIKSLIEPTMELDAAQRHLATILPAGAKGMRQLKEVTEAAEKASVAMNVSTEQGIQNVYLGLGAGLKLKDAITNMNVSMAIAKQTGGDLSETGRVLAHVVTNFGDKSASASAQIRKFGDMMNYVVRQGDVKDINEFTSGLTMAMGAAKAANVDFPTLAAVLVGFQKANITGSEAGSGVIEMVQAMAKGFGKLG